MPHDSGVHAIFEGSSDVETFKAKESDHAILLMQRKFCMVNYGLPLRGPNVYTDHWYSQLNSVTIKIYVCMSGDKAHYILRVWKIVCIDIHYKLYD